MCEYTLSAKIYICVCACVGKGRLFTRAREPNESSLPGFICTRASLRGSCVGVREYVYVCGPAIELCLNEIGIRVARHRLLPSYLSLIDSHSLMGCALSLSTRVIFFFFFSTTRYLAKSFVNFFNFIDAVCVCAYVPGGLLFARELLAYF